VASSFCPADQAEGYLASIPVIFALTLLSNAGFSPHEAHAHQAFFGWILPTIRTSEFTVLQIVGLDAAVVRDS
jgi:hypothetical protein